MTNSVYITTSLDGYIATECDGIEWLNSFPNPTESDYGYHEFIDRIDAIVMGRRTYEKVSSFDPWPYTKKVFVLSNTLKEVKPVMVDQVEIVNGDVSNVVRTLKDRDYQNLYVDGGQTIQAFLKKQLVDELILSKIPVILGKGIPLFSELSQSQWFEHCSTEVFEGGLVKSHYKKI